MQNRHPIDRLADIRKQIDELQDEADAIRVSILAGQIERTGDEHIAELVERNHRSIPVAAAERALTPEQFAQVVSKKTLTHVRIVSKP